jgi:hypothetical protein
MKSSVPFLSVLLLIGIFISSCSKEEKAKEETKISPSGPFRAILNDSTYNGLIGQAVMLGNKIYIEGKSVDSLSYMAFKLEKNIVGKYDIQNQAQVDEVLFRNYFYDGLLNNTPLDFIANTGMIELTKVDTTNDKLSGKFNFQATIIPLNRWAIVREGFFDDIPLTKYNFEPVVDSNFISFSYTGRSFNAKPATFTRTGQLFNLRGVDTSKAVLINVSALFPGSYALNSTGSNKITYADGTGDTYVSKSGTLNLDVYLPAFNIISGRFSFVGKKMSDTTVTITVNNGKFSGLIN